MIDNYLNILTQIQILLDELPDIDCTSLKFYDDLTDQVNDEYIRIKNLMN